MKLEAMASQFRFLLPDGSVDEGDLCQVARLALWRRRTGILRSPNPVASARRVARQAMGVLVRRARRQHPEVRETYGGRNETA